VKTDFYRSLFLLTQNDKALLFLPPKYYFAIFCFFTFIPVSFIILLVLINERWSFLE
jgi:hypothetical protein